MELSQTCKTLYICEIILPRKVTITVKAESYELLFKSLNVRLFSLSPSFYYLEGSLPNGRQLLLSPNSYMLQTCYFKYEQDLKALVFEILPNIEMPSKRPDDVNL